MGEKQRLTDEQITAICAEMQVIGLADEADPTIQPLPSGRIITFRFWWDCLTSCPRRRTSHHRLHMTLCALSGRQMEEQYMEFVQRHTAGSNGHRGCDSIAHMFGELVAIMGDTRRDVLGDLFQGAITYGEAGQFLTPQPVCEMMARMTIEGDAEPDNGRRTVCDPCCGSGRMLLAVADLKPHWEFTGQDVDLRKS